MQKKSLFLTFMFFSNVFTSCQEKREKQAIFPGRAFQNSTVLFSGAFIGAALIGSLLMALHHEQKKNIPNTSGKSLDQENEILEEEKKTIEIDIGVNPQEQPKQKRKKPLPHIVECAKEPDATTFAPTPEKLKKFLQDCTLDNGWKQDPYCVDGLDYKHPYQINLNNKKKP